MTLFTGACTYFALNPIYLYSETKIAQSSQGKISVDIKVCVTCIWLDPDYKKTIRVDNGETRQSFTLKHPTQVYKTRVIIGTTRPSSILKAKGFEKIIFFPSELEKLETFDFRSGQYLNALHGEDLIWTHYYSDDQVDRLKNDLEVKLDMTIE